MDIKTALGRLDVDNEEHWTSDGLPRVEAVSELVGAAATRKQITNAWPEFNRELAAQPPGEEEPPPEETPPIEEGGAPISDEAAEQIRAVEEKSLGELGATELNYAGEMTIEERELSPEDCAYVVPRDEVVAMPPQVVYCDIGLIDRALREFNRKSVILSQRREAIDLELRRLSALTESCERGRILCERRGDGKPSRTPVQDYLASQKRIREEKAERIKRYLDMSASEDLRRQMQPRSDLDVAMSQRKPARHQQRPEVPRLPPAGRE